MNQELIESYIKKTNREIELAKQRIESYQEEIKNGSAEDINKTLRDLRKNDDLLKELESRLEKEKKIKSVEDFKQASRELYDDK